MGNEVSFKTDFTQSDGVLASPWVNSGWNGNLGALQVLSNKVRSNAAISTEIPMSVIDQVFSPNQYIKCRLSTFTVNAGVTIYGILQLRISASPTQTYYRLWISSVAGVTKFDFSSLVNGTEVFFDSITATIVAGDIIKWEIINDIQYVTLNNTKLRASIPNHSITSAGRAGISIFYLSGAQSDLEIDDVEIGLVHPSRFSDFTIRPRGFAPGLGR